MLLPITFHLPPTASLIMLAGIYYGAQYGGSTTSILVNLRVKPPRCDLSRRLPDGAQGPRRCSPVDLGGRLVLRRHRRHRHHRDLRRAVDAHGAEIRAGRLLLADGVGPRGRRRAGQRFGHQGDRHGVPRPAVRLVGTDVNTGAALHLRRPRFQTASTSRRSPWACSASPRSWSTLEKHLERRGGASRWARCGQRAKK